jgi:hypothetical protein
MPEFLHLAEHALVTHIRPFFEELLTEHLWLTLAGVGLAAAIGIWASNTTPDKEPRTAPVQPGSTDDPGLKEPHGAARKRRKKPSGAH